MIIKINKTKKIKPDASDIVIKFGIQQKEFTLIKGEMDLPEKGLIVISGISGSGKTVCLKEISSVLNLPIHKINIEYLKSIEIKLKDYFTNFKLLVSAGLGDVVTLLTPVKYLSDGQKYRVQLASLIEKNYDTLLIDEFCNQLDEISTISILKLMKRLSNDKLIVVSTSRPYGLEYIECDEIYKINQGIICQQQKNSIELLSNISHRKGTKSDWNYFAQWHYRSKSPGIFNQALVFSYKNYHDVGIIVGGQPYLNISARNKIFPEYKNDWKKINKDIFQIHRIVISPEFRGLGLSKHMFDTLYYEVYEPRDKVMVELITSLDSLVPFASKAGFIFGDNTTPGPLKKVLQKLGFDNHKFLNNEYVTQFVKDNYDKVLKGTQHSMRRMSRTSKTLEELDLNKLVSAVKLMCNVDTKYYYKKYK